MVLAAERRDADGVYRYAPSWPVIGVGWRGVRPAGHAGEGSGDGVAGVGAGDAVAENVTRRARLDISEISPKPASVGVTRLALPSATATGRPDCL